MAIAFINATLGHGDDTTGDINIVVNVPTGVSDGNVLCACIFQSTLVGQPVPSLTAPSGWTQQFYITDATVNQAPSAIGFYTRVASSEPSNYTWVTPSVSAFTSVAVTHLGFSGVDASNILDTVFVEANHYSRQIDTTDGNPPDITTENDGAMIITFFGGSHNDLIDISPPTSPAMTQAIELIREYRNHSVAYFLKSSAGAQVIASWVNNDNGSQNTDQMLATVALKEDAAIQGDPGIEIRRFFPGVNHG